MRFTLAAPKEERAVTLNATRIFIGDMYSDILGAVYIAAPPGGRTTLEMDVCCYKIGGKARKVTDVCADYLALLKRMVADLPPVFATP
jgi:hypothetical protein